MTMPIPDGSVVITPRQMYDQIGSLSEAVRDVGEEIRSVKAAIDPAVSEIRAHVGTIAVALAKTDETVEKHGNRLVALETARAGDSEHQVRSYTGKAVMWTALGSICAAAAVLMAVLLAVRGGAA